MWRDMSELWLSMIGHSEREDFAAEARQYLDQTVQEDIAGHEKKKRTGWSRRSRWQSFWYR